MKDPLETGVLIVYPKKEKLPRRYKITTTSLICLCMTVATPAVADDWPQYQHDNQRSGITSEQLTFPLYEQWAYQPLHGPRPAWPPPANADYWHDLPQLNPRVTYDRAQHVTVAGDTLFFGSSADDKIYAKEASTSDHQWSFFTEGPVRLAPTVFEDNVYAGSDDGFVYCLDRSDGTLKWKYRAAESGRKIVGNGRMISVWPVRTGVLVQDGIAYFCAGLFPKEGVYLCALDARSGAEIWKNKLEELSPQGYLLATADRLYVPTGRTSPAVFNRSDGKHIGTLGTPRAEGGTYALLAGDTLISGPGTQLREFSADGKDEIATYAGRHIIVTDRVSYLLSDNEISAVDRAKYADLFKQRSAISRERRRLTRRVSGMTKRRKGLEGEALETLDKELNSAAAQIDEVDKRLADLEGKEYLWRQDCHAPYSAILAGDAVIVGGDEKVTAFSTERGEELWSATLWSSKGTGKIHGLAVSNGRLFASSDSGRIHCFSEVAEPRPLMVTAQSSPVLYPDDDLAGIYESAARHLVEKTNIRKGYCLVLDCNEGRLAYELARQTDLQIVGIEEDPQKVAKARIALNRAGLYGTRVTVQQVSSGQLPYTDYFANLVVSDRMLISGESVVSPEEVVRVLRPGGGVAYLGQTRDAAKQGRTLSHSSLAGWLGDTPAEGWVVTERNGLWAGMRREALEGGGEWTHKYADAGNSTCSTDQLVGGSMRVQWFGQPGPRHIIDRHHRPMVPLSKDGRLFVYGDDRVIAVDSYNGTPLWDVSVPHFRRVAAPRDAGSMVVTEDALYVVAEEQCRALDVATGECSSTYTAPQLMPGTLHHWGYVASVDGLLFGSGQKEDASYTEVSKAGDYEIQWGDFKRMVTSDYLFCLDRHDGTKRWSYKKGIIINPTIAVGDGRMYFVESRDPKALAHEHGKITLNVLLGNGGHLVALDIETGDTIWEQPVDLSTCQHIIFLSYADDTLLVVGSKNNEGSAWYYLYGFSAHDGQLLWQQDHPNNESGIGGDHGEQIHHPMIVNGIVFAEPCAYNLRTGVRVDPEGKESDWSIPPRKGCGTSSASALCLFYRDSNPTMYDLRPGGGPSRLTHVNRPGCWINIIPAGGLVLVPEGSSGCTCSYPLQTSIALIPE